MSSPTNDTHNNTKNNIFPISFSIPDELVVSDDHMEKVPKQRLISLVIPNSCGYYFYDYDEEDKYHRQYQESWLANTCKKGGWDCMRHYEIMANGCIPIFSSIDQCPEKTLTTLPKQLLLTVLENYDTMSDESMVQTRKHILDHMRQHCTTSAAAERFLCTVSQMAETDLDVCAPFRKPVLLLACSPGESYLRESLAIGLRRLLGPKSFIDYPRIDVLYSDFDCRANGSYGRGFSYANRLTVEADDCSVEDRSNIAARILNRDFSHIIYGKVGIDEGPMGSFWQEMPFWKEVKAAGYSKNDVSFLYNGDRMHFMTSNNPPWEDFEMTTLAREHVLRHAEHGLVFLREYTHM
jgi:hypothetical protein